MVRPVLVQSDETVVDGHAVIRAAKALGWRTVPVIVIDHLSDDQIRVLRLALNKTGELGSWDRDALKVEFNHIVTMSPDCLIQTGFTTSEIDVVLRTGTEPEAEQGAPGPFVSVAGDVWVIGPHRMICGDARDWQSYAAVMEGEQARLILADPPYNVKIAGNVTRRKDAREFASGSGEMSPAAFTALLRTAFQNSARHALDGSVALYFMDWRHIEEMMSAGRSVYSELLNMIVWAKTNAGIGSLWRSQHELVFAWKLGSGKIVNNVQLGASGRNRSNLWDMAGANSFGSTRDELPSHVTPKPVALLLDAILDVTHRGDLVLDQFAGTGSTLVAAHRAGRVGRGIEFEPEHVDTSVRRLERETGLVARHGETGLTFAETAAERLGRDGAR